MALQNLSFNLHFYPFRAKLPLFHMNNVKISGFETEELWGAIENQRIRVSLCKKNAVKCEEHA